MGLNLGKGILKNTVKEVNQLAHSNSGNQRFLKSLNEPSQPIGKSRSLTLIKERINRIHTRQTEINPQIKGYSEREDLTIKRAWALNMRGWIQTKYHATKD